MFSIPFYAVSRSLCKPISTIQDTISMAAASTTPPIGPQASGSTQALAPAQGNTKRLSTVKASPSNNNTGAGAGAGTGVAKFGAGKDVMSPGELCGFVRPSSPS